MTSFELSINFFRKIQQFFMSDFLHSKYAKRRRICCMSRAEKLLMMSGFRIVPPNCTDFQKSVSQRVLKISTREKVR